MNNRIGREVIIVGHGEHLASTAAAAVIRKIGEVNVKVVSGINPGPEPIPIKAFHVPINLKPSAPNNRKERRLHKRKNRLANKPRKS